VAAASAGLRSARVARVADQFGGERAASLRPAATWRDVLDIVDPGQIQVPATDTVLFRLKYAYAPFAGLTASPDASWVLPREAQAGGHDPAKQLIGCGPFIPDTLTPDVACDFKRNPSWFESSLPYLDAYDRAIVTNASQSPAQFSSGHLDEVSVAANDLDTTQKTNPKALLVKALPLETSVVAAFFPLGDPVSAFQDIRVRRALSMAVDRDALAKAVFGGHFVDSLIAAPTLGKWALAPDNLRSARPRRRQAAQSDSSLCNPHYTDSVRLVADRCHACVLP
jgi:peptide/nickel transport system substrate-binding protein